MAKKPPLRHVDEGDAIEAGLRAAFGWIDSPEGQTPLERCEACLKDFEEDLSETWPEMAGCFRQSFSDTLVKYLKPPAAQKPASVSIDALSMNWPGSFGPDDLPDPKKRTPINATAAAFRGILAVATILRANDTERFCDLSGAQLDDGIVYGLHDAISFMAREGSRISDDFGLALCAENEGGAA
jgi:hypothetical protein